MTDLDERYLDAFPSWLQTLDNDARLLLESAQDEALPESARAGLIGALNYLFKSLDLIPDGIEELGYSDDAFVFRVAALRALAELGDTAPEALQQLGSQAELVREYLGELYDALDNYVAGLPELTVRGRTAAAILSDAEVREEFVSEVRGWADGYGAPAFSRDAKNLVKLRAFLATKLAGTKPV